MPDASEPNQSNKPEWTKKCRLLLRSKNLMMAQKWWWSCWIMVVGIF
jgi:hypothetical protein